MAPVARVTIICTENAARCFLAAQGLKRIEGIHESFNAIS